MQIVQSKLNFFLKINLKKYCRIQQIISENCDLYSIFLQFLSKFHIFKKGFVLHLHDNKTSLSCVLLGLFQKQFLQ